MSINIKKISALVLSAAMLLGALSGCSKADKDIEEEPEGNTIGEALSGIEAADDVFSLNSDQSGTFHPYTDTSVLNHLFMPLVYENMYELDSYFNVTPKLIASSTTTDGRSWSFYIDTTAKFQDGSSLTAQDVSYSLTRAQQSKEYSGRLSNIYGVSAIDSELVMVNLYTANMQFPSLLNIPVVKSGTLGEIAPLGTGAYKYNSDHTQLVLWEGHPKAADMPLKTIDLKEYVGPEETISAFEQSYIDLVQNDPTGLSDLGYGSANEKRYCNTTNLHYLGFNQNSAFFCYPKYRYFVTYAVDREKIVTDSLGGCAISCTMPINPISELYNQSYGQGFTYNMEKAATALKNTGAEDLDADGLLEFMLGSVVVDIKINFIVCGDNAAKVGAARNIAESMRALGLEVNLRELGWDAYQNALAEGDYDMYYAEVKLSADFNISQLITENGSLNIGKISDAGYETNINDYLAASDADRKMYCDLMCKYLLDTAPIVPICFEKTEVLSHRGVISGTSITQYNVFHSFEDWIIDLG